MIKREHKIHCSNIGPFLLPPRIKGDEGSNHHSICKRHDKRKRHLPTKSREELQGFEVQEAQLEKWLERTGKFSPNMWKIEQRRVLKTWFDLIDRDKSGDIDVDKLAVLQPWNRSVQPACNWLHILAFS